jgi:hypothetical protein
MADSTSPTRKTLAILGSDGDLVTGVLVYMVSCSISTSTINLLAYKQTLGGIHLPILAELQEQDINSYAKAVQEMKDTKNELYFYTPRHRVTVQDHLPCVGVDCLLFVVSAPQDILTLSQKGSGSLFAQNKVVILVEPSYANSYFYPYCGLTDATQFSRKDQRGSW